MSNAGGLDVVGLGNAIVDVLAQAGDDQLKVLRLVKGSMALIDADRADSLYGEMGAGIEASGGSAANTMVGIASLSGRAAFIGKVKNDQLGRIFRHDIKAAGVEFETPAVAKGPGTARCLILVTPDGQRTMNTYLGASVDFDEDDVHAATIAQARITYLEGYLFDKPAAKAAFRKAVALARDAGNSVALSLSDSFCVDRHREDFLDLIAGGVDILFANEAEITALFEVKTFDDALQHMRGRPLLAALTRSEKGSVLLRGEEIHVIDPVKVPRVVDTTGAGDLYAAGVLFGLARDRDLLSAGRLGSLAAAETIGHMGARPQTSLARLAKEAGLA
ncbi:MAG: adenosine kinase [Alphaproteobacteria bacterium]|nr:adenosine kinase [Alphaproteobacteria bacterium]